jgi:hypothetical protein
MAEPTSLPPADQAEADQVYRPISLLAIAGMAVSGLFALLMTMMAFFSWMKGMPFNFPGWCLVFPLFGAVLSLAARWHINNSEGTRAGMALAKGGLWVSVLFGLGFATYSVVTFFAVRQQAQQFLFDPETGFIARLKNPDKLNMAFLLTRPPDNRRGLLSASDDTEIDQRFNKVGLGPAGQLSPGQVSLFRNHYLTRAVQQGGPATEVSLVSVNECDYKEGGYWVSFTVDVKNDAIELRTMLTVRSQEGGGEREWYVDWTRVPVLLSLQLKERGLVVNQLSHLSHQFAQQWLQNVKAAGIGHFLQSRWDSFGALFNFDAIRESKRQQEVREEIGRLLDADGSPLSVGDPNFFCPCDYRRGMAVAPALAHWQIPKETGRLQVAHEFVLPILGPPGKPQPGAPPRPSIKLACIGRVIVQRTDSNSLTLDAKESARWRIAGVEIVRADVPAEARSGQ